MTRLLRTTVLSALIVCCVPSAVVAHPQAQTVRVAFLRGEQLARVGRGGDTATAAVRGLLAGPTPAERRLGFRTYIPAGTRLLHVSVAGGLATVDLSGRFIAGPSPDSELARLSQLVATLTGVEGATRVQLLVEGGVVTGMYPGVSVAGPLTLHMLQTPDRPVPKPPQLRLPPPDPATTTLQQRLITLGYLVPGEADGRFGPATQNAILAFQKWERLNRTGLLDAVTKARLATALHPSPVAHGGKGKRAEILLDRQVALLIKDDRVIRAIAVSSGKPSTPTPPGDYRVYAKIPRWWSTPFREWLPWAIPFVGGIAFHQYPDVPNFPASHGCVRQLYTVARWTYDFAEVGMPVKVIAKS